MKNDDTIKDLILTVDYLEKQIEILAKNDQKLKDKINSLQRQVNALAKKLEQVEVTAINGESLALMNQTKIGF